MRNLLPQWEINYSMPLTSWPYQSVTACKDKWWGNHLKGNHYGTSLLRVITFISAWEITLKVLVLHWEAMFWLGLAKMTQSLPAFFKAFLGQFAFQRHPQLVWRATPEVVGTIDLLLIRESNQGGEGPFPGSGEVWVAANIGIGRWTGSSSRVLHWKYRSCPSPSSPLALHRLEGGIRVSTRHQLGGRNFKQRAYYSM